MSSCPSGPKIASSAGTSSSVAAKQAIDSFLVRTGDVLSAALVFAGTTFVALPSRGFATVNVVLALVALILAWRVGRHYNALTARAPAPAATA